MTPTRDRSGFGVTDLTVRFSGADALHEVSARFARGRITAVVGADGSGKTTLLRALVGLVEPVGGTINRPDVDRLGFVPTGGGSWSALTVAENVSFVAGAYGLSGPELAERAGAILNRAGLTGARDRLAGQLSGGMRAKLGFTLALLHDPDLLVMDEPTTGVDPVSRVELWGMISEAAASGAAVVLTTTDIDEAQRANMVVLLGDGRVLLSGTPDELTATMPGAVIATPAPTRHEFAWRVGPTYHEWLPGGAGPDTAEVSPSLEDVCIVAELAERSRMSGGNR